MKHMLKLYVTPDSNNNGHNTFSTITAAIARVPKDNNDPVTIDIAPGIYHEKVTLDRPYIHLIGTSADECIITYGDYARDLMPDGSKRGTFRSYTFLLDADHVVLENLTIRNSSFPRSKAGQAVALYADGDHILIRSCRLESYQDTLFTGPLPPAPMQIGGFTGPKEFADRRVGRQYYKDCYICGDVDFIFGSAIAYFENCEIASVFSEELPPGPDGATPVYGYATAASTPQDSPYGYVFDRCRFTSTCPRGSVYLGRPWRDYAQTILLNCYLGEHIHPEGFHDWNKPDARKTCYYAEYNSTGPGADNGRGERAAFVHSLSDEEALLYTKDKVLAHFPIP